MTVPEYIAFLETELAAQQRLVAALKASHQELQATLRAVIEHRAEDGEARLAALTARLRAA